MSAAAASSTVREFIYLDESRVFSYLSQLEGGLRLLGQKVESALDTATEQTGGDATSGQHNIEGSISPTAAAAAQLLAGVLQGGPISPGVLTGLGGKYTYQRGWSNTTPNVTTENRDGSSRTDLSILHHAAFDLIMQNIQDKFVIVKGKASILELSIVKAVIDAATAGVTDPQVQGGFDLLKAMEVKSIAYVETDSVKAHAFLRDEWATMPLTAFLTAYGMRSEMDFTLVGLHAQNPGVARRHVPFQVAKNKDAKGLYESLNTSVEAVTTLFGADGGIRLYPIAIYRDL